MRFKRVASVSLSLSLIVASVLGILFRQNIYDWYRLNNYQAPVQVAQLAADVTMNEGSKRLFYVQHPEIEDKTVFRNFCSIYEQTIVLGCYSQGKGIFILKVDDPRLQGVEQVTAAHEFLHAAYDRLSSKERRKINGLLESVYRSIADSRIKKTVESYRSKDASVVPNELHSILGTEYRNLPAELENYYKRYFNDRAKIVGYSENYEEAFNEIKTKVESYDAQLGQLKSQIDQLKTDLALQAQAIQQERQHLDSLLSQKDYEAYNAGVDPFNQKIQQYNVQVVNTQSLIQRYNQLVEEQKALIVQAQELYQAIDTRVPTLQQQ